MAESCDLSRALEGGSDFLHENECAHCRKCNDISLDSNVFCTTCKQYLCRTCGKYHVRNMPSHQLMDVSNIQPTQSVPSPGKTTTPIQRINYTMRSSCKVNVKVVSDKQTCKITDMCQLSDGTILLIDRCNNKLKRLVDTNKSAPYRVKDFLEFKSSPVGICSVSSSEVAVRLDDKTIQFISVNESLTYKRQVSMNHPNPGYRGLACCSDQFWVPGYRGVYLYSLSDGSLLKYIEKDSQGSELFPNFAPQRIAVRNDGSMVFVTAGDDRVVVFNKNGDYIREIRDKRLVGACGICITCDDIVLVSGSDSKNVLMFDKNGVGLGELVSKKDMSDCPWSLCYDKLKCRLLVSNYDILHVFDLA